MTWWALTVVIISSTWAYVATRALDLFLAKQRAKDVSELHGALELQIAIVNSQGAELARLKERMARLELKRA